MKYSIRRSEVPYIEFSGNVRVLVGQCDGILEYEPECIKLRAGKRQLRITGQGLDLCNLAERTVLIRGTVADLAFED